MSSATGMTDDQGQSQAAPAQPAPVAQPAGQPQQNPAGPGVMRNILGVFLTGLTAGISQQPGRGAPERAAAAGAQAMGQSPLNPANQQDAQLDSSLKKAQLGLMQVQIQRQMMIYHSSEPLLKDAQLNAWMENGKNVMENASKGNGEILFQTAPDQSPDDAHQALLNEWGKELKTGYDVIPFASGDPSKPTLGLYRMKSSKWQGGDYWSSANAMDPEHPIQTRIPDGIKAAGTPAVQKWGLTQDNNIQKQRHDAEHSQDIAAQGAQKMQMFNARQDFERWKTQFTEQGKNARAQQGFIRTQNGEVQKAFKAKSDADKNLSHGLESESWWNNMTGRASSDTQALVEAKTAADANWAEVQQRYHISDAQINAGPPKKASSDSKNSAGGRIRVKLADGRPGTIDAKDFDPKTMTKNP